MNGIEHGELPSEVVPELQQLFDQLPDAAEDAAAALRVAGPEPGGMALQSFCDRAARLDAIIDRIKAILELTPTSH
jgi:hypothetical protein